MKSNQDFITQQQPTYSTIMVMISILFTQKDKSLPVTKSRPEGNDVPLYSAPEFHNEITKQWIRVSLCIV